MRLIKRKGQRLMIECDYPMQLVPDYKPPKAILELLKKRILPDDVDILISKHGGEGETITLSEMINSTPKNKYGKFKTPISSEEIESFERVIFLNNMLMTVGLDTEQYKELEQLTDQIHLKIGIEIKIR